MSDGVVCGVVVWGCEEEELGVIGWLSEWLWLAG